MDHATWVAKYRKLRDAADRVERARIERARRLCREAGLDPNLLGIHPHNAMVSLHYGKPWPEADYSKVRACLHVLNGPSAYAIVDRWDRRIRVEA